MSDWLHDLPVARMAITVFVGTFLVTGAIYATVMRLAMDGRGRSFKAVSPGLLLPLGIILAYSSHLPLRRSGTTASGHRAQ